MKQANSSKRALCLWLPHWSLQRLYRVRPELNQAQVAIYEEYRPGCFRIVDCAYLANRQGVRRGMPLAEATALTSLILEKHDPSADLLALEKLAAWCEQFSPAVAVEAPDCLLLDVTGLGHLFGGEDALVAQIRQAFRRIGLRTRIAVTETFAGAWSLAHFHDNDLVQVPPGEVVTALADLPIASLNLPQADTVLLEELGICDIGQLLSLPREQLSARFEPLLLQRLDHATGRRPESLVPYHISPDLTRSFDFESPISDRFLLEEIVGELLQQVLPSLASEGKGITKFACLLNNENGSHARLDVSLYQPTSHFKHLLELASLQLEKISLSAPVSKVQLYVCSTALLTATQLSLFGEEPTTEHQRSLSLLVNRLSSRLGPLAVCRAISCAETQAEFAYRYQALTHKQRSLKPTSKRWKPHHRPIKLLPTPTRLCVLGVLKGPPQRFAWQGQNQHVLRSSGPERIEVGWWRGDYVKRDYYRVETKTGHRFWLFRDRRGDWFLHGIFD